MPESVIDKVTSLSKRRGFIFPSSDIYGGINACWDYGPLGVRLKGNIKNAWMRAMTQLRDDIEPLDAAILMHPRVWEASGHVENFTDPLVDCRECRHRFRADEAPDGRCPNCRSTNIGESRQFNLMFKTFMGPVEDEAAVVYLRPETAQGIYVNFENVRQSARRRIPFGIAQIGKAFRN
ncbi:MAG: glycine--tRNA ligase, partial [Chloroflexota bacterium]|nr:glycine--tRNA ligase [Chloroflexota bacterium]